MMDDFHRKAALFYGSALSELLYLQSLEENIKAFESLFKEKNVELTEEIREEISIWVQYHHANSLVRYFYRRKNGGEPKNPLLRLNLESETPSEGE